MKTECAGKETLLLLGGYNSGLSGKVWFDDLWQSDDGQEWNQIEYDVFN